MSTALTSTPQPASNSRRALLARKLRELAQQRRHRPLSFAQQRLWFLDQLEPNSPLYNVAALARVEGSLDFDAVEHAINSIIARHEALRTRFATHDETPEQVVVPSLKVALQRVDLSAADEPELEAQRFIKSEILRPFCLAELPLLRPVVVTIRPGEYRFLLVIHHIIADEWSLKIFFREFEQFYSSRISRHAAALPDLPIQYADFAEWQREWLQQGRLEDQLKYWKEALGAHPPETVLPPDQPGAPASFEARTAVRALSQPLSSALARFAQEHNATVFMVLQAVLKALLHRYTQQEDILIGSPVAGRNQAETQNLIGFFVNTLLLRTSFSADPTFNELVERVRQATLGALAHQDVPFDKIIEELHPQRSLHHVPLAHVMFVHQNQTIDSLELPGVRFLFEHVDSDRAKFDLTLLSQETPSGVVLRAEFKEGLYAPDTIARMLGHFEVLLSGALANPTQRISQLPLLSEPEKQQILIDWNRTVTEYPRHHCVHEIFEQQALSCPDHIAVRFGDVSITYYQLNCRANQLAHYLRQHGVGPGIRVGICLQRSIAMPIGLLGILKAGGAYVPLDARYPKERLAYMLEDTRAPVLITQQNLLERLPAFQGKTICLDADWELIAREEKTNLSAGAAPEDLAYVMYTSGSTGRPKGVAVPHRAISRLVINTNYIHLDSSDRIAQVSNFSFDAATFEFWGALLNGAQLIVITRDVALSPKEFAQELKQERITAMFLTSALFNQLAAEAPGAFEHMRTLIAGGEALDPKWVRAVLQDRPPKNLVNGYGPTENTTFTCCHLIREVPASATNVPIGKPIANTQVFILDRWMNPVPIGVAGELYAAGDGLARGYLERPELTAERFVPNPFAIPGSGPLLYRTGDLARFLPDGFIEFLGRMDGQVKIRGFRIELGEIETALSRHPDIRECVVKVVGRSAGEKKLIAYFVPAAEAAIPNASELRAFLVERLPEYMVPSAFVQMEAMPLTDNGKINRHALPAPDQGRPELERQYVAPSDEVELQLTSIWEKVLNVHPIGVQDKFFDLGGHSLLAVRVIAQIEKMFSRKLRLATIFQAPTIQQLAAVLRQEIKESSFSTGSSLVEIQSQGELPPLFLVHGAGGGMFWGYVNLAHNLGPNQPVYGFKSRGLDGREEFDDLPRIAAQYIADLRMVQSRGPYYLGGYCFGGIVAFEMARQLTLAGETVPFVGLLNCAPPNSRYTRIPWTPKWWLRFARNLVYWANYCRQWSPSQRREFLRWKWALLKRRFTHFRWPTVESHIQPGDLVDLSSYTEEQRKVWEAHIRALVKYRPAPYPGTVSLFRSSGHPLWCSFDPDYGWGGLAKGGVSIKIVPGAHEKILEEDCVEILAGEFAKALQEARGCDGKNAPQARQKSKELGPELPAHHNYAEQFRAAARNFSGLTAVQHGPQSLTYSELDERSDRLAQLLRGRGVGPDALVGICLHRSVDLAVALLGVIKAGGAYLPLDPAYPADRLAYMVQDSRCPLLLTESKLASLLPNLPGTLKICLDEAEQTSALECCSSAPLTTTTSGHNLVYVIYTSGSTGFPKGVCIHHAALLKHNAAIAEAYNLSSRDRVLQFAPLSFDLSVEEIFPSWLRGATVVMRTDETVASIDSFLRFVEKEAITVLNLPTAFWHDLAEHLYSINRSLPGCVRLVVIGGEKPSDVHFAHWKECVPGSVRLMNGYGVTEATITSTLYEASGHDQTLPIGRPIANTSALVLDEQLKPVPVGMTGELFIAGAGVARGYLRRPELTRERFIPNPFLPEISGETLYRTGDLVRAREDGVLEYIGRIDDQVKIRGFRIELAEIEAALLQHPDVKDVAVAALADHHGKKRLVAYVVGRSTPVPTTSALTAFLRKKLPDYMVPSFFVALPALPLSPAGKVDRAALPAPGTGRPDLAEQYEAPQNAMQQSLAEIWSQVLTLCPVGINDNFFDLGGHSLLATQVVARISERFRIELSLGALFAHPTIAELSRHLSGLTARLAPADFPIQGRRLPLTAPQQRIWFLDKFEPLQSPYNRVLGIWVDGPLEVERLREAIVRLSERHQALRAVFPTDDGQPKQYILPRLNEPLTVVDLTVQPEESRERVALQQASEIAAQTHITSHPMLRSVLYRLRSDRHLLLWVLHDLGADAQSVRVLFNELVQEFGSSGSDRNGFSGQTLSLSYEQALGRLERLGQEQRTQHIEFWKTQLAGASTSLDLPTDQPRAQHKGDAGARHPIQLPVDMARQIEKTASDLGCTSGVLLLSAFASLLQRYTGNDDFIIGCPVSLRRSGELQSVIAPLENTVPLRCRFAENLRFAEIVRDLQQTFNAAVEHASLPVADIIETQHIERNPSRTPLFQVIFAFEKSWCETRQAGGLKFEPFTLEKHTCPVDLRLLLYRREDGCIDGWIEYSTELFREPRIRRMKEHLLVLLTSLLEDPCRSIKTAPLLSPPEFKLLQQWNETSQPYPRQLSVAHLFLQQAGATPDSPAVVWNNQRLTYSELRTMAESVTASLTQAGVGRGDLVGICLERSPWMVASILGTLLSGAAYVPLDPAYPTERLQWIANDGDLKVLLSQSKLEKRVPETRARVLLVEEIGARSTQGQTASQRHPEPDDLAYVIYTSGSTGKPKGVAIEHRSVVAFLAWAHSVFSRDELAGVLASTSICFDLSIFELFVPLTCGGKVVLAENALALPPLPSNSEVTLVNTVPSAIRELLRVKGVPPSVRVINLAGEPLPTSLVDQIYAETKVEKVYDLYGPTETTTYSTFTLREPGKKATIGRPLGNESVYIFDRRMQLLPIGIPGELFIGGIGLARGYLNRPDLTAERFIPNPFVPGERLYRTGDLARWQEDGTLEYLGRIDHQVKIRGFRVELGEIESTLKQVPNVSEAVVLAREDRPGDKRLAAYIVSAVPGSCTREQVREKLKDRLPDYMVPSAFVFLDKLPLTPNGKVDRKALPAPDHESTSTDNPFVPPRNPIEEQLADIWAEVLHIKRPGIFDNFFDLGGHSLLAVQVISRIREICHVELPLFSLFTAPTIAALAEGLSAETWKEAEDAPPFALEKSADNGPTPLSFVQERLWFIDQLEPGSCAYNVPAALRLKGALDLDILGRGLNAVVRRHEALRTTFQNEGGSLSQVVAPALELQISVTDLGTAAASSESDRLVQQWLRDRARQPFDLSKGPLIRASVARLASEEHLLMVVMHHTVSDGWSLAILFQELATTYDLFANTPDTTCLAPLPLQYGDFARWQRNNLTPILLERHLNYWRKKLVGAPDNVDLPIDSVSNRPRTAGRSSILLLKQDADALLLSGRRENATPFMLLLSALALTLAKWTGQQDMIVGTVVAGRTRRELESLIGCFMNFLPLREDLRKIRTGQDLIAATRNTVLEGQTHQDCPFEKIVEVINPQRRLDRNPLYNVALLLQNFPPEIFASKHLEASLVPVATEAPLLDLRFEAEHVKEGLSLTCEYRKDLFGESTIISLLQSFRAALEFLSSNPHSSLADFKILPELAKQAEERRAGNSTARLAIAASFTGEPLADALNFWSKELQLPFQIDFAPYAQVLQTLLDPAGLFSTNQQGLNVVLLRVEDWLRNNTAAGINSAEQSKQALLQASQEFTSALKSAAARFPVPVLVCLCPPSQEPARKRELTAEVERIETILESELQSCPGVYVLNSHQILKWYPVNDYCDLSGDELGHVPYTSLFYSALATAIVRVFHRLSRPDFKVIAVDCDNTLWSGVCGEDGAFGIQLDPPRLALQNFLKSQAQAGMLLVLCSKNNAQDVEEVFACRKDLVLSRNDFVAAKLNWDAKSKNLAALAKELSLGPDSFIFIDDNAMECAEVEANCPGVLALHLPEDPNLVPAFLDHCWAFDHLKLTAEDRRRAETYRQNTQREELRANSSTFADFLTGLKLEVQITPMSAEQLPRVSQLTLRTNQFNTTTHRRSEAELQQLLQQAWDISVVTVRDRFGDYGLTGVMVHQASGASLNVDALLLSCRVLGRGVEHKMMAELGRLARSRKLEWVDIHFIPSLKNNPAVDFLDSIGASFKQPLNGGFIYRLPAGYAAEVFLNPNSETVPMPANSSNGQPESVRRPAANHFRNWRSLALELNHPAAIHKRVEQRQPANAPLPKRAAYCPPGNAREQQLCSLWQNLLHAEQVGTQDNFFDLGGHSLLAVRLFSEIEKLTGRKFPLVTIFQAPTIEQLARALDERGSAASSLLVPIRPGGNQPPLFLVHGAGGDVLWGYANLAPYLPPERPVYGIKSRGQLGLPEHTNLSDMAACYLAAIRELQPHGPYFLGGYCFGGNVAYEIARQARAAGEHVALVALLDSAPSNAGYEQMQWWQPSFAWRFSLNAVEWLKDFSGLQPGVRRKFLARKLRSFGRKVQSKLLHKSEGPAVDLEEIIDTDHFPENELKLWQVHLDALVKHSDKEYDGSILLLRTRGQPLFCSLAEDFCWGKLARGGVKVVHIPGSHESIFMEPNVRTLAETLSAAMAVAPDAAANL